MLDIIGITIPVFGIIAIGYGTVWKGVFKPEDLRVLGRYALNVALPALLFMALSRNPFTEVFRLDYITVYGVAALVSMGLTYLWFTLRPTGPARKAIAVMGAGCPNSGYLGLPILLLALPGVAESAIAMNLVVENLVLVPLSLVLLDLSRPREGQHVLRLLVQILKGILKRPMVIGMYLGIFVSLSGLTLPVPLTRLVELIAGSTAPIALFVIGGSLVGLPMQGNFAMAMQVVFAKLVLHPMLAAVGVALALALGFSGLEGDFATALIITSAVPMLGIYAIIAQEYGHEGMASIALLAAVVFGFFTTSALLYLLL